MNPETEREAAAPAVLPDAGGEGVAAPRDPRDARLDELSRELVLRDLEDIRAMDPNIREPRDLLSMPEAREFSDYVHRGMSLRDAYYLTHRQQLEQRAAEAGRRQALSEVRSKEHLSALGPVRGGGAAAVPPEELRWFRALNPEAKDADIQDYYNRARRGK